MAAWLSLLALIASSVTGWGAVPSSPPASRAPAPVQVFELARSIPPVPAVKARASILLDVDAGRVLLQQNGHLAVPPASLTKVVTALTALDLLTLDQPVTVPTSINQLPWDSTRMGLHPGDRLTVRELLYGLFLNSGNDAAISLAEAAMPRATFVQAMNAKAHALGMADSHFVNPVGLDEAGHLTSATDLATAAAYLTSHYPEVARMAATLSLEIPAAASHGAYHLYNLNQLLRTYPGATGLKTGWTGRAGGCVIVTATRDGRRLLAVVMGSPRVFDEGGALLDYGFALIRSGQVP